MLSGHLAADNFVSLDNENLARYWGMDKKLLEMSHQIQDPDAGFFIDAKTNQILGHTKTKKAAIYAPAKKSSLKKKAQNTVKKIVKAPVKTVARKQAEVKQEVQAKQTQQYKGKHILSPIKMEEEVIQLN